MTSIGRAILFVNFGVNLSVFKVRFDLLIGLVGINADNALFQYQKGNTDEYIE